MHNNNHTQVGENSVKEDVDYVLFFAIIALLAAITVVGGIFLFKHLCCKQEEDTEQRLLARLPDVADSASTLPTYNTYNQQNKMAPFEVEAPRQQG